MAIQVTKDYLLNSKNFAESVKSLYSVPLAVAAERTANLIAIHEQWCSGEYKLFSSPGRIEVCGNHTDHNNGKVIAAAVTVDTLAVVTPTSDSKIIVKSVGYPEVMVDITDLTNYKVEEGTSQALVRGVLRAFKDRGYAIGGFLTTTTSDVFKGAGMSSSASFEVLVAEILNQLYNGGKIEAVERAIISQFAENVYFGKPSGLMDQSAIAIGGVSYIDFKDTKSPIVKKLHWNFNEVSVVVVNCGGDHCDLTPQYAAIKGEMEGVAKFFGQEKLRFVKEEDFYARLAELKVVMSGRAILRAMHYFEENERVDALASAVERGDLASAMRTITASGVSSYDKLQNCYPDGNYSEPIPLALAICEKQTGVVARRVHGGGFAGTILTFVRNADRDTFVDYMSTLYGAENVFAVGIRQQGTCEFNI